MRTKHLLLTVLALTIRVMVSSQTQGHQAAHRILPVLGSEKTTVSKTNPIEVSSDMTLQIEKLEVSAKQNREKFAANRMAFYSLMNMADLNDKTIFQAQQLNKEANFAMKMANEMREEAYAEKSIQAKLGRMSNAEEREIFALVKQEEAIGIIKEYIVAIGSGGQDTWAIR